MHNEKLSRSKAADFTYAASIVFVVENVWSWQNASAELGHSHVHLDPELAQERVFLEACLLRQTVDLLLSCRRFHCGRLKNVTSVAQLLLLLPRQTRLTRIMAAVCLSESFFWLFIGHSTSQTSSGKYMWRSGGPTWTQGSFGYFRCP